MKKVTCQYLMNVDTRTAGGDTKVTKPLSIQIEMKKKGCETDVRLNASIDFLPFSYSFSQSLISYMYTAAGTYRIFFIITLAQPMKYCGCLLFCCPVVCPSVATLFLFENIEDQTIARMYLMNIFKWPLTICEGVKREKKSGWKSMECAISQNAEGDEATISSELLE